MSIGYVTVKTGAMLNGLAPAGIRLLAALEVTARRLNLHLVVTCGTDSHPPNDPHSLGVALDIRTNDQTFETKKLMLNALIAEVSEGALDAPMVISNGLGTSLFWGWIENPGAADEHLHAQLRHGRVYPPFTAMSGLNA